MTRRLTTFTLLAIVVAIGAPAATEAGGSGWLTDLKKAKAKAKKNEWPILIEFSKSDSSEICQKLTKEVFRKSTFRTWAKKNVVLLSIDFPTKKELPARLKKQNEALLKKFDVDDYPTVLLVNTEDEVLGRFGYVEGGAEKWLGKVKPVVEAVTTGAGKWLTNFEKAKKFSKATGRPILVDFTGSDWCGWCIKLKKEVFDTDEFKKWATKSVVLLELDFPRKKTLPADLKKQNEKLRAQYKVGGYPTILFLDASEKVLAKSGYLKGGPSAWIADAEKKLK